MTVQELIDELMKVKDKSKEAVVLKDINFPHDKIIGVSESLKFLLIFIED